MKEDVYKRFVEHAKGNAPVLKDKEAFHQKVMATIGEDKRQKSHFRYFLNVAASIIIFISIGFYAWFEIDTRMSRLALASKQIQLPLMEQSEWQCRHSVNELMASVATSNLMPLTDNGVLVLKSNVLLLKDVDYELYNVVIDLLTGLQQTHPTLIERYNADESIMLSAWQLRRKYHVCEWLVN